SFQKKIVVGASLDLFDTVHHIYIGNNKSIFEVDGVINIEPSNVSLRDPSGKIYKFEYIQGWKDSLIITSFGGRSPFRFNFKYRGSIDSLPGYYTMTVDRTSEHYLIAIGISKLTENVTLISSEIKSLGSQRQLSIQFKDPDFIGNYYKINLQEYYSDLLNSTL